jgi:hypothetical protein
MDCKCDCQFVQPGEGARAWLAATAAEPARITFAQNRLPRCQARERFLVGGSGGGGEGGLAAGGGRCSLGADHARRRECPSHGRCSRFCVIARGFGAGAGLGGAVATAVSRGELGSSAEETERIRPANTPAAHQTTPPAPCSPRPRPSQPSATSLRRPIVTVIREISRDFRPIRPVSARLRQPADLAGLRRRCPILVDAVHLDR